MKKLRELGLPRYRWSIAPADALRINRKDTGNFVASIGVGNVWADKPQSRKIDPAITQITNSLKEV